MKSTAVMAAMLLAGCASMTSEPVQVDGQWTIGRLQGEAIRLGSGDNQAELTIAQGKMQAYFGCNRINGQWPEAGQSFGPQMSTRMGCQQPVAGYEQRYNQAMAKATGYQVQHGRLQILNNDQVILEAYKPTSLDNFRQADGNWSLVSLRGMADIVSMNDEKAPELSIDITEGKADGDSGCNRFFGKLTAAGDALWLDSAGMTMMACPEPMSKQEQLLMSAFSQADHTTVDDDKLQWWQGDSLLVEYQKQQ